MGRQACTRWASRRARRVGADLQRPRHVLARHSAREVELSLRLPAGRVVVWMELHRPGHPWRPDSEDLRAFDLQWQRGVHAVRYAASHSGEDGGKRGATGQVAARLSIDARAKGVSRPWRQTDLDKEVVDEVVVGLRGHPS